jgi:hypothetical protein
MPTFIPKPRRYSITYTNKNGIKDKHEISLPIEDHGESFTAYDFTRHGVRTFIKVNVSKIEPLGRKDRPADIVFV